MAAVLSAPAKLPREHGPLVSFALRLIRPLLCWAVG